MDTHLVARRHQTRSPLGRVAAVAAAGLLGTVLAGAADAAALAPVPATVGGSYTFGCGTGADAGWAIIEFSLFNDSDSEVTLGVWNNNAGSPDSSFYVPRIVPAHGTVTYRHRIASGATGNHPGIELQPGGTDLLTGQNESAPVCVQIDETPTIPRTDPTTTVEVTTTAPTTTAETPATTAPTTTGPSIAVDPTTTAVEVSSSGPAPTTTVAVASGGPTTSAPASRPATLPSTGVERTSLIVCAALFVGLGTAVLAGARRRPRSTRES